MEIEKICILGAGAMGHGIAQVCAQHGFQVVLEDIKEEFVQSGITRIQNYLKGSVERRKITQDEANAVLCRIKTSTNLAEAVKDIDLIIEVVSEDLKVKRETFRQLDQICPSDTIFASNTSYLTITELSGVTKRPDKVIGMHWFNPPQIMRGIEVIKTEGTSMDTVDTIVELCKALGKEPAICKDSPGFIANRLLQAWRNQCSQMYDESIASFHDIDKAMKNAYDFKMGPFELNDLAGLEITLTGIENMYRETGKEIFRPAHCHIMKVKAGELGRKTGKGFYEYTQ